MHVADAAHGSREFFSTSHPLLLAFHRLFATQRGCARQSGAHSAAHIKPKRTQRCPPPRGGFNFVCANNETEMHNTRTPIPRFNSRKGNAWKKTCMSGVFSAVIAAQSPFALGADPGAD